MSDMHFSNRINRDAQFSNPTVNFVTSVTKNYWLGYYYFFDS